MAANGMKFVFKLLKTRSSVSETARASSSYSRFPNYEKTFGPAATITSSQMIYYSNLGQGPWKIQQSCEKNVHHGPSDHHGNFIIRSPYPDLIIPDDVPLPHLLMNSFSKYGNLVALIGGETGQEMTYSELQTSVARVSSALVKLGIRPGDVVTIFSHNCLEYAIAAIAVSLTGAVFSSVNPAYTADELKNALDSTRSKIVMTVPPLLPLVRKAVETCTDIKEIIVFGEAEHCRPFSTLLADDMTAFPENHDFSPKTDLCTLPFSSGTTGLPKGVMLSHYNLVANIYQSREKASMGYEAGVDCLLAVLPFFHIYGQSVILFSGLACGAKIVTLSKFQPTSYLQAIEKYRATFLHTVPPMMLFLAKHPSVLNYKLSSVKTMFVGAAPCPTDAVHEVLDKFKNQVNIRQGYGLTETSPLTHCNPPSSVKYHTIGPAVHNTQCKVTDLETLELLGPGKVGEVCIHGPQVMLGYYKNEEATNKTIKDGWLHTGDVGYYDDDGHIIIVDRIKEMIKVKGFQVAPAELEAVLVSHPKVQDAAVIGIKDERLGEAPKAFVVLKPQAKASELELSQYVEERVAPFKSLVGGIEFRDEIPKSASGKILRRVLRDENSSS